MKWRGLEKLEVRAFFFSCTLCTEHSALSDSSAVYGFDGSASHDHYRCWEYWRPKDDSLKMLVYGEKPEVGDSSKNN